MSNAKASTKSKAQLIKILVVYGFGGDQKTRAAVFAEPEIELARKAADLMGLSVFDSETPNLSKMLKIVPKGRVYASGWGFVPYIRRSLFDDLIKVMGVPAPKSPKSVPQPQLPTSWDSIDVGHLVLGQADSAANGWWPTLVESVDGDMLRLQARDFPDVQVVRHRSAVALLYTSDYVAPKRTKDAAPGLPSDWKGLAIDQLVLAEEASSEDGWFEAIITEIVGDELSLRWRDYPKQPKFKRPRYAVARLNPTPPKSI